MRKQCKQCKTNKPATAKYFYVVEGNRDRLSGKCKKCINAYNQRNRYKYAEYYNTYFSTPEFKKHKQEYDKEYREKTRDHRLKLKKQYYEKNKEVILFKQYQYRINNPEIYRLQRQVYHNRREARKKELPYKFTQDNWDFCLNYFKFKCAFCGTKEKLQVDHIIPLSNKHCLGTIPENIIPLCKSCNSSKSNNNILIYLQKQYPNNWQNIFCNINNYINLVVLERPHI